MLAYLDTVIGFVVVMLAISLLITILIQMVSALVNHRGGNLQWGLKTLFANIDPKAFPELTAQADSLARQVLTHCLISDSWFSGNRAARWLEAGIPPLRTLFARFRLASAIRPSELANILAHLAATMPTDAPLRLEIERLLAANNPTASRDIALVAAALPASISPLNAIPLLGDAVNTVRGSAGRLEAWFGSMMDRVAQKFATYMRLWTVAFACMFALATGLNALNLAGDIYRSGVLRDALVNAGQQLTAANAATGQLPKDGKEIASQLTGIAQEAGIQVVAFHWPSDFPQQPVRSKIKYLMGVFLTAALLSLGAPFWFNALKSLANLRPILAAKQQAEQKQA